MTLALFKEILNGRFGAQHTFSCTCTSGTSHKPQPPNLFCDAWLNKFDLDKGTQVNSSERRSPYTELWENCLDKIWPSVVIYHIPDFCYAAPLVNRVWTFFRDLVALTHCLVKTIED